MQSLLIKLPFLLVLISTSGLALYGRLLGIGTDNYVYKHEYLQLSKIESIKDVLISPFEKGYSLFTYILSSLNLSFEDYNFFIVSTFVSVLILYFFKSRFRNFLIFTLFFLNFGSFDLLFSTDRQLLGFIIVMLFFVHSSTIYLLIALSFHLSFALNVILATFFDKSGDVRYFKYRMTFYSVSIGVLALVTLNYIDNYKNLDPVFLSTLYGGYNRLLMGIVAALFYFSIVKVKSNNFFENLFNFCVCVALIFPIGWRLFILILPFIGLVKYHLFCNLRYLLLVAYLLVLYGYKLNLNFDKYYGFLLWN